MDWSRQLQCKSFADELAVSSIVCMVQCCIGTGEKDMVLFLKP